MINPDVTLLVMFKRYHRLLYPDGTSELQRVELERAFMAGAATVLQVVAVIGEPDTSEDEGVATIERLQSEFTAFAATLGANQSTSH